MRQQRKVTSRSGRRVRVVAEELEARRLLCGQAVADLVDAGVTLRPPAAAMTAALAPAPGSPAGLPLLHSRPGAAAAVYLDFDGYGSYAPYDTDGDPSSFGEAERADIAEAWRQVASYFSMLDLDVTTEPPGVPYSYSLISNSITSGQNLGGFPALAPTNFNTASQATARPSALAHEIGHSLGLEHQSVFDRQGVKTAEYAPGYDRLHGSVMGLDYAQDVHKWFIGHPSASPLLLQDDLAVMAATLRPYTGGDGFRPDDVSNTLPEARAIASGPTGGSASGIIERLSDRDAFSFTSAGGSVALDVVPPAPSMLDAKLEVYAADGTLIAAADGPDNDQHLVFPSLTPGTYYAIVSSHADYADVGPYDLTIREDNLPPPPPPVYNDLPAPSGVRAAPVGSSFSWNPVAGASGYLAERSEDGIVWETAGTLPDPSATGFFDSGLEGGRRYFYRVSALNDSGPSAPSAAVSLVTVPTSPTELTVSSWRTDTLVLNWRDVSGETGYRVERAAYGSTTRSILATLGPNVTSFTDRGVQPSTLYTYRVTATDPRTVAPPAEVTGGTPLAALQGLHVVDEQARIISLQWGSIAWAREYVVERSTDGLRFNTVATVKSTRFDDAGLQPATKYTYRVTGYNIWYQSATSEPVSGYTLAAGELPAPWQVVNIGYGAGGSNGYDAATDTFAVLDGFPGTGQQNVRFVYQPVYGDKSITARVATLSKTPDRGLAGVVLAAGLNSGDDAFFLGIGPVSGHLLSNHQGEWREVLGVFGHAPYWVRLVRSGSRVDAYISPDGSFWQLLLGLTSPLGQPAYMGLGVSAGYGYSDPTPGERELALATFDHVVIGNTPPSIVNPASVLEAPVTGTSASLSVLGRDDDGEANLTYTWSASTVPRGVVPPAFSPNGTNGAKATKATFSSAGFYNLSVRITDPTGLFVTSSVAVNVVPKLTTLVASPQGQPVHTGGTLQFSVRGLDQFGTPLGDGAAAAMRIDWHATGESSIDSAGLFTAPAFGGWYTVVATATAPTPGPGGTTTTATATVSTDVYVYNEEEGPTLLAAWSRKTHGRRGAFDLPLMLYGGRYSIEPRRGGLTTLRFKFSAPVVPEDGTLDASEFFLLNATFRAARVSGAFVTLDLADVADRQLVVVEVGGLTDVEGRALVGDADVWAWSVYGDVNADGAVNAADLLAVRQRLLRPVGATDFLRDLDLDGAVTAYDLLVARRRVGPPIS